ncbi:Hypp8948 [Branchiostoma lanceolatum]|uniref:Hypp8948 protein n=1 Tax=Branchiostoma lanceolatum TaxID=7740 RepID=A0A8J9ZC53_BRALA|nr:Hypp8948 [Branchiostoma lanceolatum]
MESKTTARPELRKETSVPLGREEIQIVLDRFLQRHLSITDKSPLGQTIAPSMSPTTPTPGASGFNSPTKPTANGFSPSEQQNGHAGFQRTGSFGKALEHPVIESIHRRRTWDSDRHNRVNHEPDEVKATEELKKKKSGFQRWIKSVFTYESSKKKKKKSEDHKHDSEDVSVDIPHRPSEKGAKPKRTESFGKSIKRRFSLRRSKHSPKDSSDSQSPGSDSSIKLHGVYGPPGAARCVQSGAGAQGDCHSTDTLRLDDSTEEDSPQSSYRTQSLDPDEMLDPRAAALGGGTRPTTLGLASVHRPGGLPTDVDIDGLDSPDGRRTPDETTQEEREKLLDMIAARIGQMGDDILDRHFNSGTPSPSSSAPQGATGGVSNTLEVPSRTASGTEITAVEQAMASYLCELLEKNDGVRLNHDNEPIPPQLRNEMGENMTYEQFKEMATRVQAIVHRDSGRDIELSQLAMVFGFTKFAIKTVGVTTDYARVLRNFCLEYLENTFAGWIASHGWGQLTEQEPDPDTETSEAESRESEID